MKMSNSKGDFFQSPNRIFRYGLTPIQFTVYSYLVSRAGQNAKCWTSVKTIAAVCGCSQRSVRAAVKELDRRAFIRSMPTYGEDRNGRTRQTNNTYYVLELPPLPAPPLRVRYVEAPTSAV